MFSRTALLTLSSVSLLARAQLPGQSVTFRTELADSCLSASQNADGAPVILKACGTNSTQLNSWVVTAGVNEVGQIKIFGDKCLDVKDGVNADGTKLQIWTCAAGNTNQMWNVVGNNSVISWANHNKAVDVTDGNTADGTVMQVWAGATDNTHQQWIVTPVTEVKTQSFAWFTSNDRCITASSNTAGSPVVVGICDPGVPAQMFFDPSGTGQLAAYDNMCITPAGKVTTNGVKLELQPCDPANPDQSFALGSTRHLTNTFAINQSCIDVTDGNKTEGNQLQLWTCGAVDIGTNGDNTNQDWLVTSVFGV